METCTEPRSQSRIEAIVTAWRRTKNITHLLRQINLAYIDSASYLIAEVMAAEIYLEHEASAGRDSACFFGSSTYSDADNLLYWGSPNDHSIFLINVQPPVTVRIDTAEPFPGDPN